MIDVLGRLLNGLKEMHHESEAVICHTVQAKRGHVGLCLERVKVLY